MARILLIDDEIHIRESMADLFEMMGHQIDYAVSGNKSIPMVQQTEYDVVFLDYKMADGNGMDTLPKLLKIRPSLRIIMMSAYADKKTIIEAMHQGAWFFIEKPFERADLQMRINAALKPEEPRPVQVAKQKSAAVATSLGEINMIGNSKSMGIVMEMVHKAAPTDATVLILGENGTGKELIAQSIHHLSSRSKNHFLAVNCSAFSEGLIDTSFFGSEDGAYTGSKGRQKGIFEIANDGTIFLDEIADLTPASQDKLLRVLETQELHRVGSFKEKVKVDVRIIAATNKNLPDMVRAGTFREDLFYRINVLPIMLPALRDRKDDIPLLIAHFNHEYMKKAGKTEARQFSAEAIQALTKEPWNGNIRQLKNLITRLNILCERTVTLQDVILYKDPSESSSRKAESEK
jgi:two-component system, NtrC family, nitrogen regulation response regulator NtrX